MRRQRSNDCGGCALCLAIFAASSHVAQASGIAAVSTTPPLAKTLPDVLLKAVSQVGINPGATTEAACAKLKTLKAKFVTQLKTSQENLEKAHRRYATKICEGLGCETDEAKRIRYQAEWDRIQASHVEEHERLETLLAKIEGFIEEPPFRRCPEFEGYLASKHQLAYGKDLLDQTQNETRST
eukprot:CAMPEP_0115169166 /NCGR_PEP_ID=MMETSP0270-20121206/1131_1 /TAXON_ID=71861 /ORGANISM="Scrippsiella trochoidea, Strain CCMP3099" /LENGTH=182 /DNA_ID=CAMNT_0002581861 /DNA_START=73 /DNA_END=621 /DNA_ORIENTATION=+